MTWKTDDRPKCGWWAPGSYMNKCRVCEETFIGDKRAGHCADCAYKIKAQQDKAELEGKIDALRADISYFRDGDFIPLPLCHDEPELT
jgi:hypothetical protein